MKRGILILSAINCMFLSPVFAGQYFSPPQKYYVGEVTDLAGGDEYFKRLVRYGDFNNDDIMDIFIINRLYTAEVSILYGNGDGTFSERIMIDLDNSGFVCGHYCYGILDANHDGFDDVIVSDGSISCFRSLIVFINNGTTEWDINYGCSQYTVGKIHGICDCDHDGYDDFIAWNIDESYNIFFSAYRSISDYPYFDHCGDMPHDDASINYPLGDFNGDGWTDFLASSFYGFENLSIFYGSDSCNYEFGQLHHDVRGVLVLVVGNFNEDSCDDIAYRQLLSMETCKVNVCYGSQDGILFSERQLYRWLPGEVYVDCEGLIVSADVNSDGLDDICVVDTRLNKPEGTLPVYFHFSAGDTFSTLCDTLILDSERDNALLYSNDFNDDFRSLLFPIE